MKAYKTQNFSKWAKKSQVTDEALTNTLTEIEKGRIDADLGSGLIKQRVATKGRGKSGSVRTLIAIKVHNRAFFVYGFEKSDRGNIGARELHGYRMAAKDLLNMTAQEISQLVKAGKLKELP